jgi:hypothetical protein
VTRKPTVRCDLSNGVIVLAQHFAGPPSCREVTVLHAPTNRLLERVTPLPDDDVHTRDEVAKRVAALVGLDDEQLAALAASLEGCCEYANCSGGKAVAALPPRRLPGGGVRSVAEIEVAPGRFQRAAVADVDVRPAGATGIGICPPHHKLATAPAMAVCATCLRPAIGWLRFAKGKRQCWPCFQQSLDFDATKHIGTGPDFEWIRAVTP